MVRSVAIVLFLLAASGGNAFAADVRSATRLSRLVICPPAERVRDLFAHPNAWQKTRAMTGAILYADHILAQASDAELRTWFTAMRMWNIHLALEVGAIKEWGPTADATFRAEAPLWDRFIRLGAEIGSIAMDEPLGAAHALHKSDDYAVEQTARFVEMVRQRYPHLLIGDVEPYPGLSLTAHVAWIKELTLRLRESGQAPLDFYRIDPDWVAFTMAGTGSWRDVASIAALTRSLRMDFSLIFWASGYPWAKSVGLAGEDTWFVQVLDQGYAAREAGISPDQFVIESWISAPSQTVPEETPFTFTGTALDFARKFVFPDKGASTP